MAVPILQQLGCHTLIIRIACLLFLCTGSAFSAENLHRNEYAGEWVQVHPITEGETSTLLITEELAVRFTRSFSTGYPDQHFSTPAGGLHFIDDIAIVEFHWENGELAYKLVVSGWCSSKHRRIFGTMFMYRDGKLFNGLPVGFKIDDQ